MQDWKLKNKVRVITAASLFDGHDASINIMRRVLQSKGAEVIHLGHNRSVQEIIRCALQEDAHAIALTSYQGGHIEFFKYAKDLLNQSKAPYLKVFGGGGGTILPKEIEELTNYGIDRIYSPDDGRRMGLEGMIEDVLTQSDYSLLDLPLEENFTYMSFHQIVARTISFIENDCPIPEVIQKKIDSIRNVNKTILLGITGTGGAGKSSITDELVRRFQQDYPEKKIAILSIDPSRRKTGGALLGDRIRMNSIDKENIYMRSIATREANTSSNKHLPEIIDVLKKLGFDLIIVETAGTGQSDTSLIGICDVLLYAMTPEYGAATQLEKIGMLDYANFVIINKSDRRGAVDAHRDVAKQYQRNHSLFHISTDKMPIYSTIASRFNDPGINKLYLDLLHFLEKKYTLERKQFHIYDSADRKIHFIIPPDKIRYLSEIAEESDKYNKELQKQSKIASNLYSIHNIMQITNDKLVLESLHKLYKEQDEHLLPDHRDLLYQWDSKIQNYKNDCYSYTVRNKEILVENYFETLSHLKLAKIQYPKYKDWGDIILWSGKENFPGEFPYTAGVYPFKRKEEDPIRMFAGEGGPERTNKRFHYLSLNSKAIRLSTAFDSVTLYGEDPEIRPDILGKIGNSGVSVASLDDAKRLYSGFNLCDPSTSVSMTINGPAPMLLAYFFNAAIDQQCEIYIRQNSLLDRVEVALNSKYESRGMNRPKYRQELPVHNKGLGLMLLGITGKEILPADTYQKIKEDTISKVRGTVQADILKEDQAQNTCIFSSEFALKMMGDIQEYFIHNSVRNFYSVSISGYHIAEAGANPITQLAFTLANGFSYVEYYLSRGMHIDSFAPNLSFFFSNGMEPEYSVIGRVARRIWSKAMKYRYGANERSQMLKYHIQTSGRSLHAQEIDFNDIRTTLQALYAIYDNCNSLHTNAYDEAITTPTEESVRRAVAIQMIINKELGTVKTENFLQGSFVIEELTDLVEEAVYSEFRSITERGGVLGAMENMYQRNKIQDESMYYESLKMSGQYPIIGVNTFLNSEGSPTIIPQEVIRSTEEEKHQQIQGIKELHSVDPIASHNAISKLKEDSLKGKNIFESLMDVCDLLSLGQMTHALYEVGGQYRRNM